MPIIGQHFSGPLRQPHLSAVHFDRPIGSALGGNLQHQNPEAVDVGHESGGSVAFPVLRRHVAHGAGYLGGDVGVGILDASGEAEVSDVNLEVGVQEDIAGFDVSVDYWGLKAVQVG